MKKILNYVWLSNDGYYCPEGFASQSPIPAEYVNNALCVAARNPEVQVVVWCDFYLNDRRAMKFFENFTSKPENLSFQRLCDIPAYQENKIFQPCVADDGSRLIWTKWQGIWKRVDLARLFALEHSFKALGAEVAFYSDFDVLDPPISGEESDLLLGEHGAILSHSQSGAKFENGFCFQNGFMGFDRRFADDISNKLIKKTIHDLDKGNGTGWTTFRKFAGAICNIGKNRDNIVEKLPPFVIEINTLWGRGSFNGRVQFDQDLAVVGHRSNHVGRMANVLQAKICGM